MRTRTPAALAIIAAITLAACGRDSGSSADTPVTTEAMADTPATTDAMADTPVGTDAMTDSSTPGDAMGNNMADEEMAKAEGDLIEVAAGHDDLSTFVAAVDAAGLTTTLQGDGPFTIFAPNNAAFEEYLGQMGMSTDDAFADPAALAALVENHVVQTADDSSMVAGMVDNPFVSLAGNDLPVTVDGTTITIGGADIVEADIFATNGVIHVIDTVLAP